MKLSLFAIFLLSACTSFGGADALEEGLGLSNQLTKSLPAVSSTPLQTITFGSCNKQGLPQPLWRKIAEEQPDLFVWTGDVVYGDTPDMQKLARIYTSELEQPEYRAFLATEVPVIGVYDDHDYGKNDGDGSWKPKLTSQKLFLDFIGEAQDSPRRQRAGIYTSYLSGPLTKRVKTILLDTRYHLTKPGPEGDVLGAEQWRWLEAELAKKDAELVLVVSSIQVIPSEHRFEKWANFPASRQRLLKLIDESPASNILLISGDRHFAELSKLNLPSGRELWEVTSSGLTHSYLAFDPSKNQNSMRVGPVLNRLNYGLLKLDWQKNTMRIEVRDINREAVIAQSIPLLR